MEHERRFFPVEKSLINTILIRMDFIKLKEYMCRFQERKIFYFIFFSFEHAFKLLDWLF